MAGTSTGIVNAVLLCVPQFEVASLFVASLLCSFMRSIVDVSTAVVCSCFFYGNQYPKPTVSFSLGASCFLTASHPSQRTNLLFKLASDVGKVVL